MKKIYIFGAHARGRTLKEYINYLYPEIVVESFLVNEVQDNPLIVDGIKVRGVDSWMDCDIPVYLATRGVYHDKIRKELESFNIKNIIPVDVDLDTKLRNEYVRKKFLEIGKTFDKIYDNSLQIKSQDQLSVQSDQEYKDACVYVASSVFDKTLCREYILKPYEKYIQVGTVLTDKRIEGAVYDCMGENISAKNKQYCELTGLYWLWKNAKEDYIGLEHYRRHFLLPENWVSIMKNNEIDVILPVPLYVAPNLADNFRERHAAKEWDCMMEYLKESQAEHYHAAKEFFKQNLFSPCNMLIAKRQVLHELCEWLFPILEAVVKICGEEENSYDNRYPGFLSEWLMTYYFESQRQRYQVVYADKDFCN